ncbi:MAG: YqgE/AlgH family protein [Thermonemataceae bacterium]|nr:YqgE/AlgH family protein [Thermonemataceae bacterium]
MEICKGDILIASPFLEDTNFEKSVILITECNETGHIGFILNKPLDVSLQDVLNTFVEEEFSLFYGGPVSDNALFYVHRFDKIKDAMPILPHLYWGGDFEQIKDLIARKGVQNNDIRFFAGYSGWSPGQLEEEIKEKAWILQKTTSLIMKTPVEFIWRDKIRRMNNEYAYWANMPANPSMN